MTRDIQSPILYDTICMPWYILHTGVGSKLNIEKKVILKIMEILIRVCKQYKRQIQSVYVWKKGTEKQSITTSAWGQDPSPFPRFRPPG